MRRNWTRSIVPTGSGDDHTVYPVVNNLGHLGIAFTETDVEQTDLETVINDLKSGQYSDPVRVVAFNTPNIGPRMHRRTSKAIKPLLEKIYGFAMPFSPQQVSQILRHLGILDDNTHSIWEKKLRRRYITRAGIKAAEDFIQSAPLEALRAFGSKAVIAQVRTSMPNWHSRGNATELRRLLPRQF
jgi:hypothetical protein